MFFDKLIRNIVIFLIGFVLAVNIYYWTIAIQVGTQDEMTYVGFYQFFKNFEKMPRFEYFTQSIQSFSDMFTDWSGWKTALAVITLGISVVAEFCKYVSEALIMLFIDLLRIFIWLFGFIGVNIEPSPILQQ